MKVRKFGALGGFASGLGKASVVRKVGASPRIPILDPNAKPSGLSSADALSSYLAATGLSHVSDQANL
jgi:hypothetical protein